jgi:hypothetical protein
MLLHIIAALALAPQTGKHIDSDAPTTSNAQVKTVAVLPWMYRGGTGTAVQTAKDTINLFFDKAKYEQVPQVRVTNAWENQLGKPAVKTDGKEDEPMPDLPSAKDLLALGRQMHVDMVCAGKVKWHTKSVWISLGPKTKADATVDVMLVDVNKEEVALEQHDIHADDTRRESGLETAGALFLTMGITAFSGGPATPHQQNAVRNALGLAFEPWLKTTITLNKKIQ